MEAEQIRTRVIKQIMEIAEHYKHGNLHGSGAMADFGMAIDNFAKALLEEAAEKIEQGKDPQSILQCSKETGLGAVTQVYFRKGTNWAKEIVLSLILKKTNSKQ